VLAGVGVTIATVALGAQRTISRADYFYHVPDAQRIGSETDASRRLSLFGDPTSAGYRDVLPRDGIDDVRSRRLRALATRFAPILRRNNFSVPRQFSSLEGWAPYLHIDTWRDGVASSSDSLDLGPQHLTSASSSAVPVRSLAAADDARLDSLLRAFDPRGARALRLPPGPRERVVLYFDFPGADEKSWRKAYSGHNPRDAHLYVHAFLDEADSLTVEARYVFVIQYWMFYPFNDGPNNHEGDWERINVSITTQQSANANADAENTGLLSESDIARMLDSAGTPIDSLIIREVNYFFHQHVFTLNYLRSSRAHDAPATGPMRSAPIWEDAWFVAAAIKARQSLAGGRLATHPLAYIGGNNRGADEFLSMVPRFRNSYNRNSHGTYPFPGTWRSIGALGATERVFGAALPALRRDLPPDGALYPNEALDDRWFVGFDAEQLTLVPDWERIVDLLGSDAGVRREWGFLVLPIRWGFPASVSPGGGAVRRANLGNVAPLGLAFHTGWNRAGADEEHHPFDPHVLRILMAPNTPMTALQDGWGVLNLPIALWQVIPGGNAVFAQFLPWVSASLGIVGAPPARTFVTGQLPTRFTSFGVGRYTQFGGNEFGRFLPREEDTQVLAFLMQNEGLSADIDRDSYHRTANSGTRLWFTVHYSDRIAFENTLGADTTEVSYRIAGGSNQTLAHVRGELATGHATSGIRFTSRPMWDVANIFARVGTSWTWYRVRGATLDGAPVDQQSKRGGHWPSLIPSKRWWPNSMYGGLGAELFAPRSKWLFGGLGYGVRFDMSLLAHPMRGTGCGCISRRQDASVSLQFGW